MKPLRSIRWRLQLWYGLLLALALGGFGITAFQLEKARRLDQTDEELRRRLSILFNALRPGSAEAGKQGARELRWRPGDATLFDSESAESFYYVVWLRNGPPILPSKNAPAEVPKPAELDSNSHLPNERPPGNRPESVPQDNAASQPQNNPRPSMRTFSSVRTRGTFREAFMIPARGDCLLVGCSVAAAVNELHRMAWVLATTGSAALAFCLFGGWWLTTRAMRPIRQISETAAKIAAGDLRQRIDAADTDSELGQLAVVLNATFSRLEASFAQQSRFAADAAHELRTPVSVLLTHTESALECSCAAEEHREAFEACQRAARRMRRLIESLMELTRLDSGQEAMRRQTFDLAEVAIDGVELVQPLAKARGILIETGLKPALCIGDPDRIGQVIANLLTNAIQYNREGGQVRVTTSVENGLAHLSVTDTGPGISSEHLPHIFERFYRVDKARRATGGQAGLGLAIVKGIVEAHGGVIAVSSQPGAGTTFVVDLPREAN